MNVNIIDPAHGNIQGMTTQFPPPSPGGTLVINVGGGVFEQWETTGNPRIGTVTYPTTGCKISIPGVGQGQSVAFKVV